MILRPVFKKVSSDDTDVERALASETVFDMLSSVSKSNMANTSRFLVYRS